MPNKARRSRTKKDGRPKINDANYCRLKGWTVGTVLTLDLTERIIYGTGIPGRTWVNRVEITAIGESGILVRRVYDDGEHDNEEHWSQRLVNCLVIQAGATPCPTTT
jgi:hypothetical protein